MTEKISDLDKFIALYKSLGITLEPSLSSDKGKVYLTLEQGANNKFTGYAGFGSAIEFDIYGKFVE